MVSFQDHIDNALTGLAEKETLYEFKKDLLDEMTDRANSLIKKGLTDDKVINELIISEYPHIKADYIKILKEKKAQKRAARIGLLTAAGVAAYVFVLTAIYLAVSFITGLWGKTWLIMVGGIFAAILGGIFLLVKRSVKSKGVFRPLSRIFLAVGVFIIATFMFLCLEMLTQVSSAWLIFLFAVIAALVTDSVYATLTKQHLAVINYMIYIPIAAAVTYVALGIGGLMPWHPGWLIIVFSVVADLFIAVALIIGNGKYMRNGEVLDLWNED